MSARRTRSSSKAKASPKRTKRSLSPDARPLSDIPDARVPLPPSAELTLQTDNQHEEYQKRYDDVQNQIKCRQDELKALGQSLLNLDGIPVMYVSTERKPLTLLQKFYTATEPLSSLASSQEVRFLGETPQVLPFVRPRRTAGARRRIYHSPERCAVALYHCAPPCVFTYVLRCVVMTYGCMRIEMCVY